MSFRRLKATTFSDVSIGLSFEGFDRRGRLRHHIGSFARDFPWRSLWPRSLGTVERLAESQRGDISTSRFNGVLATLGLAREPAVRDDWSKVGTRRSQGLD